MDVLDIEDINRKFDDIIERGDFANPTFEDSIKYKTLIDALLMEQPDTQDKLKLLKQKYNFPGKNSFLYKAFLLTDAYNESNDDIIKNVLRIKRGKSHSGVLVVTVFTSPYPEYTDPLSGEVKKQKFTCKWNCAYCPNEPGQPRSYLKGEPGVLRANRAHFDTVRQMHDRMNALFSIGHPIDKLEVIVLGGTWTSYPEEYREKFCRDVYYAANVYKQCDRPSMSLVEEKAANKTAHCKVIGLTLETRPDTIDPKELMNLRRYGCTRVQLGIQHLHQDVLDKVNRRCSIAQVYSAIKQLKDSGFKVDGHFMPNLPGSSVEKDKDMLLNQLLGTNFPVPQRFFGKFGTDLWEVWKLANPSVQIDQWKVYPCAIVPWTDIETWYKNGEYVPYNEESLVDVLLQMKALVFPWIRLNRIVRDIPKDYIICSSDKSNLRQELTHTLGKEGKICHCIRCREVKNSAWDGSYQTVVRQYDSSDGSEFFISAESKDCKTLYGFLRLRFPGKKVNPVFPELTDSALIRELHVYGQLKKVINDSEDNKIQHRGIGKHLMYTAEVISRKHGKYNKISVIAGEGTKGYYESLGYTEKGAGGYMIKYVPRR